MLPAPVPYCGRFAPSPTGDLHAGSLLAALGSWLFARRAGGQWLVRVEDLDPPREVRGATVRQLHALNAFGLHPDAAILRQSTRGHAYQGALDTLLNAGLAFECHCSRSDLAAAGVHRTCTTKRRARPSVRLRVPDGSVVAFDDGMCGPQVQDVARDTGDFVLRRSDGLWAYQLAVVVDDAAQGVTEVVRGQDLLGSTGRQILLQRALELHAPRYAHLPLVLDADGRKLSKSDAARPLDPDDPLAALNGAWCVLGQHPPAVISATSPVAWLQRALSAFDPARIPTHARRTALHHTDATHAD